MATSTIVLALLLPGLLYTYIAIRSSRAIHSVFQFLPMERYLGASSVGATILAAGMSMATVMVALLDLAPLMGSALFVTVVTYVAGFVLLAYTAPRIMELNKENMILQEFLGHTYSSDLIRKVSTFFSVIGYLSVFSMEILVSVSILAPFFGSWILAFAVIYLTFLLIYTGLSGFRGIVATDGWQLFFIFLSLGALFVLLGISVEHAGSSKFLTRNLKDLLASWKPSLAFALGVAFMNIPAPISDAGTWQRICASRSIRAARTGIFAAGILFTVIWSALILLGITLSDSPIISEFWTPESESLVIGILETLASGPKLYLSILFILILGLFSAMISTADSLLLAATHVSLTGFGVRNHLLAEPESGLRKSRWLVVLLGITSFGVFVVFHLMKLDVVQLVFAIYGAQLAMWPTTVTALFFRRSVDLHSLRHFALASICAGFATAWTVAIWSHATNNTQLQFCAPAVGLGLSSSVLLLGIFLGRRTHFSS